MPKAIEISNQLNDAKGLSLNTKLNLSKPQITNSELDEIAKWARSGGDGSANFAKKGTATKALIGEYSQRGGDMQSAMRTPMMA